MSIAIKLAEKGLLPDTLIRWGIRSLLRERLANLYNAPNSTQEWIQELKTRPIAEHTAAANEQHYEIPAAYFQIVLGPYLKYSSGYWPEGVENLEQSEVAMLALTCERADVMNGQRVLELGCGWGSLSLWMAQHYPNSQFIAVSNSRSQREFIIRQAHKRGLNNLEVITCDINQLRPDGQFDRVVSVEMFEHVRNHRQLFGKISEWLKPSGKLFVHIFCHHQHSYLFEEKNATDWMAKYFFTGGIMPSAELLPKSAEGLLHEECRWMVDGRHYSQTLEAWLAQQDANKGKILGALKECYGKKEAALWARRWRIFYMACSELFAYNDCKEWLVMHYRFCKT